MNEKKKAVRHIENNNMEKVSPSLSVTCKWSKLPNQKKQNNRFFKTDSIYSGL